ncbi:hypothetical protein OIE77_37155 [Streptomyces sp. NBC_01715]|uniref:hypothetical protein n=1 Tax=Streptomyces sp. NBC_01715 TaxID=2975916 RepID=UPI002E355F14|nr:hypothetical protein [Streptomyces sp. NBC_01715]
MPLCDYFSAADDEAAVAAASSPGEPERPARDTVCLKGIDPVAALARLEAIVTGCGHEEAGRDPRSGLLLSEADVDGPLVFSVSDTLVNALTAASGDDLRRFARSWSATAELRHNQVDAETAAGALEALTGLARRARSAGLRLYCRWSL